MTPKQQERIKNKISKIKAALAADRKRWGGYYNDGSGLRYMPPRYYIELSDFRGGLRYLNWFKKNFPDDSGYPDFLFESTIILFETGKMKPAKEKAWETFCRNTYLFDVFFEKPLPEIRKWEGSNLETREFAEKYFHYSFRQDHLTDFASWLSGLIRSENFNLLSNRYLDLMKELAVESDVERRRLLNQQVRQLGN